LASIDGAPPPSPVLLRFGDREVHVDGACNLMSGSYTFDGEVLEVSELTSTLRGCPDPQMEADMLVSVLLQGTPTVTVDGGIMTIATVDLATLWEQGGDPPVPSAAPEMALPAGVLRSMGPDPAIEVVFAPPDDGFGTLTVNGVCLDMVGTYTI